MGCVYVGVGYRSYRAQTPGNPVGHWRLCPSVLWFAVSPVGTLGGGWYSHTGREDEEMVAELN
jgi:hypothetical protein